MSVRYCFLYVEGAKGLQAPEDLSRGIARVAAKVLRESEKLCLVFID